MSWVFEKTMFNYKITCVIIGLMGQLFVFEGRTKWQEKKALQERY